MKTKRAFRPTIVTLEEARKAAILAAVKKLRGNVLLAAERLEISETTLYRKLKEYGAISKSGGGKRRKRSLTQKIRRSRA